MSAEPLSTQSGQERPDVYRGRTAVLGVTGSIAAYKAAQLTSNLHKKGVDVHVIMTQNATKLVAPATFETLSGNRVSVDTFDRNFEWNVQHISLAKRADAFLVAPATANFIAKLAHGIADDMLTSTILAARCPKVVCPAMNTGMYENPATQENMALLRARGILFADSSSGYLACGDEGKGRLCDYSVIEEALGCALTPDKPLKGKNVLISAGATQEAIDPVRYITNHSSGKMGYALARAARALGAQVTLVSAPANQPQPWEVRVIKVTSAAEMCGQVLHEAAKSDIVVMAAAVADYTPSHPASQKIKKSDGAWSLALERTWDILLALCREKRRGQVVCGFSMETQNLLENSRKKLQSKGCDMIVANSLSKAGSGFGVDTNEAALITAGDTVLLPLMTKDALALEVLRRLARLGDPARRQ